jgi:transcriptional regulator with XRE-family HTH domain
MTSLQDWQSRQLADPEFVAESEKLELGYEITRLRLLRGLTRAQLAEIVGTRQASIARLENGNSVPSLSFLGRIAKALDARIELRIVPRA